MVNLRKVQQKKKGEKGTQTQRVAVAYALLNSDRESY